MKTIAEVIEYERVAWCEKCREAYAPPRDWHGGGDVMALKIWTVLHNREKHPRRVRSGRFYLNPRHNHDGRTDCR